MHRKLRSLFFALLFVGAVIGTRSQQPAPEEFASILGRFGIMLPQKYSQFKPNMDFSVGGDKLTGAMYKWLLDSNQAMVSYADGSVDFEAKPDAYLKAFRDNYVQKAQGSVISENAASLSGHPGLAFVFGSGPSRAMAWVYLVKNRLYLMSLSLNDSAKTEEHVKLMSTFRFLTREDLAPRYAKLIEELTPPSLPHESPVGRPTTDAQDAALKGQVKQIVTEREPYFGDILFGDREVVSVEDFDQRGNLTRAVLYLDDLPRAVRTYGHVKGERVFRELRRLPDLVLANDPAGLNNPASKSPAPAPKDFKVSYKHDSSGQLLEMRVVQEGGEEFESWVYRSRGKTLEHTYDPAYAVFGPMFKAARIKTISKIDANGNPIEDATTRPWGTQPVSRKAGDKFYTHMEPRYKTETIKHQYELDDRGNWIKRKTISNGTPSVTYRTITYYQ